MARITSAFLTVVLFGLASNVVYADSFGVTLRYWDVEESAPGSWRITPTVAYAQSDSDTYIPGLNLRWSPDFWENHDFLFSYYSKERDRELNFLLVRPGEFPGETRTDIITSTRSDYELLVRSRVNENVFFYYGLRHIERKFEESGGKQKWELGEVGLGLANSFSENGRHSVFGNAVVGFGRSNDDGPDQDVRAVDLNLGYQYDISLRTALSLRYRSLSLYLDNELSLISSGLDLGVTFNFD